MIHYKLGLYCSGSCNLPTRQDLILIDKALRGIFLHDLFAKFGEDFWYYTFSFITRLLCCKTSI